MFGDLPNIKNIYYNTGPYETGDFKMLLLPNFMIN